MATYTNHVAIAAGRNGTNTHTVDPSTGSVVAGSPFVPTAGRLLLCVISGPVTSYGPSPGIPPAGWTEPPGGSAINNIGLYLWGRTAVGGDTITVSHNAANYPAAFDLYEFPEGSTLLAAAAAVGVASAGGAGPALSGLSGTYDAYAAVGQVNNGTTAPGVVWSTGIETCDTSVPGSPTDGYTYSATHEEGRTDPGWSAAAEIGLANSVERLVWAVQVAGGGLSPSAVTLVPAVLTLSARVVPVAGAVALAPVSLSLGVQPIAPGVPAVALAPATLSLLARAVVPKVVATPRPGFVARQVAQARVQHAAILVDGVDVLRPSTAAAPNPFDPRTSALTKVNAAPVPALVQASSSSADDAASPGAEDVKVDRYVAKISVADGFLLDVRPGDWLEVTASVMSPDLAGKRVRVLRVQRSSVAVVSRIHCALSVPARVRP